jgi:hypothetical protein
LNAGQQRIFNSAAAPTGTVVACLNRGVRAEMKVPPVTRHGPQSFNVIAFNGLLQSFNLFAFKGGVTADIHITRQSLNRVVVTCTS